MYEIKHFRCKSLPRSIIALFYRGQDEGGGDGAAGVQNDRVVSPLPGGTTGSAGNIAPSDCMGRKHYVDLGVDCWVE
jgi:hypothetical protein